MFITYKNTKKLNLKGVLKMFKNKDKGKDKEDNNDGFSIPAKNGDI